MCFELQKDHFYFDWSKQKPSEYVAKIVLLAKTELLHNEQMKLVLTLFSHFCRNVDCVNQKWIQAYHLRWTEEEVKVSTEHLNFIDF